MRENHRRLYVTPRSLLPQRRGRRNSHGAGSRDRMETLEEDEWDTVTDMETEAAESRREIHAVQSRKGHRRRTQNGYWRARLRLQRVPVSSLSRYHLQNSLD